jgi:secreted PhoX family phosphatase
MIATNATGPDAGRYLFSVFETGQAGIHRTDLVNGTTDTIWASPAVTPALNSHVAFDASRWTPWGTYLTAEESWRGNTTSNSVYGRLFELTNPLANLGSTNLVHRNIIPRVSHEGLAFDKDNSLYYIDELNGGSIYKYVSDTPTNGATYFDAGVNYVLRVGDGNTPNATGAYSWVAFTDNTGTALSGGINYTDPNGVTSSDGRFTTNDATYKGTDYQRPEDLEIQTLANGDQILYVATTTTNDVYSLNLATNTISRFLSRSTIDEASGNAVGTALTSPDNLAIDAQGNIYVIEDQPGGSADIWFGRDANRDGVAESMARWASMSTVGAEPTGLYFDMFNRGRAFVNVQHPDSDDDRLIELQAVPEPGTWVLMSLASLGLLWKARRKSCE